MKSSHARHRQPEPAHAVIVIGDVAPGGSQFPCAERPLGVAALREVIERLRSDAAIVPITQAALPDNPWREERARTQVSLAFAGGYAGHCEYVVPLLVALEIPAHLFVPLEQIGQRGRASLVELRAAGAQRGIRLEVDLSTDPPHTLWGQVEVLRRAAATLAQPRGPRPRYVWFGSQALDVRARLLLQQTGYTAAITEVMPAPAARRGAPILPAWPLRSFAESPALDGVGARP